MKLGSLFDGSGGFPLAGALCGITPVWASEVEPYPIAVTRSRFPSMRHLGDVSKVSGADIEPVDIITFGSPCQDLSVAGKRAGLKHTENGDEKTTRSGLFMEAVRIIEEMREKSGGEYPTFAVWENVPGAFSSNNGEDFRTVLEELARIKEADISIPRPEKGKWAKAGVISGDGYSIAWRTFDAQYWGVPQRRRRIAVVVDLGGQRAGEVLFECEGVSRYSEPCVPAWKGIARNPANCAAGHDSVVEGADIYNGNITEEVAASLTTATGQGAANTGPSVLCLINDQGGQSINVEDGKVSPTLRAESHAHEPVAVCRASAQANAETYIDLSPTITTLHNGPPIVFRKVTKPHSADEAPRWEQSEVASTINTFDVGENRCNELVVFESHSQDARYTQQGDTSPACTAQWGTDGNNMPLVAEKSLTPWENQARRIYPDWGAFPALASREKSGQNQQAVLTHNRIRWIVRRLTPTECERLQGFPDGWTDIGEWVDEAGKKHKPADSPRYKAIGNSIALPQWWWLTCKMAKYLPEHATLGSLFDGIGGFPLVWESYHGKGTAVWASEIEQFPIAVTKKHFSEEEH